MIKNKKSILKLNCKLSVLLIATLMFAVNSFAQKVTYPDSWGKSGISLKNENSSGVIVNFSINEFTFTDRDVDGEVMKAVQLPGHFLPNNEGAPDLPGSGRYIAIPQGAKAILKVIASRTEKYSNVNISPAPRIPKDNENGPLVYKKDRKIYTADKFYPSEPVLISPPTKIRGVDAVMLGVTPFQYNPVTKELIVYRDIEIEVTFEGGNGLFGDDSFRSLWFDPILKGALLNKNSLPEIDYSISSSANSRTEDYEYIIIVPDDPAFISWADSLKQWRIKQGIRTGVVTTTEIGGNTTTAIENYIDNAYNTWDVKPVAVLLIGDFGSTGNTIISPIWDYYCASDHIYADVNGNDMADVILARMTAQNEGHLETMIGKILDYERNPPTNPDFYDHPITALGWQTSRWFQICSESVGGFFKNIHGKDPVRINAIYAGNPNVDPWSTATNTSTVVNYFGPNGLGYIPATPAELGGWTGGNATDVNNAINSGAFILQHRDHGGITGWGEPAYNISNMSGLSNDDLVFVFSINCLTGKFNASSECFAEAFHRHQQGALGIIAASEVSYSFVNDTYVWGLYDNLWPEFMPDFTTTPDSRGVLPAFGNAAGKYFLEQSGWPSNPGQKERTYNLFHHHGGAFSTVYSEMPQHLTVIHDNVLLAGLNYFTVTANEGSLIALTVGDEIIGTGTGTGAPLNISIYPQYPPTMVEITVTKQNYFRYNASVQVIPPVGAYVIKDSYTINDNSGNGNGEIDYGESILLSLTMKNVGSENAENITVDIETNDDYITLTTFSAFYGNIPAGDTTTVVDGFAFDVANNIPDEHVIYFNVIATDGDSTWNSNFNAIAYAPVFTVGDLIIDDNASGNGDGYLDPGETADIIISSTNIGHAEAFNAGSVIFSSCSYLTINSDSSYIGNIPANNSAFAIFNVTAGVLAPPGTIAEIEFEISNGAGITANKVFEVTIGKIPILIVDLDPNNSSGPAMYECIENIGILSEYATTLSATDLNSYTSIFVCLGIYPYNYVLQGSEGQLLADFLDNGGNLYMEGGDTWYYNTQTAVHEYFKINATLDGSDDLSTLNGQIGSITEGLSYSYAGENKWIDHISPVSPAELIFENQSPIYDCGVAYDAGDYKTIGVSFEFGGLVNGTNTKQELMEQYLEFFGFTGVPVAPVTPTGQADVCVNAQEVEYYTNSVENADLYIWIIEPEEAGTVNGTDTLITINWNDTYTGETATIKVCGMNQSGSGPYSDNLLVNMLELPYATLSGEASICYGDSTQLTVELTGLPPWEIIIGNLADTFDIEQTPWSHWVKPETTTEFTIFSVTHANGCTNSGSGNALVTVYELPQPDLGTDTNICINHVITLYPGSFVSYEWFDGSTEPEFVFNAASYGIGITDVSVIVTDENGCEAEATVSVNVEECAGIEELDNLNIGIYPNPNNGIFTLKLNSSKINKINYRIVNSIGNVLFKVKDIQINGEYENTIDLSDYSEGIYFLIIENKKGIINKKIVIQ